MVHSLQRPLLASLFHMLALTCTVDSVCRPLIKSSHCLSNWTVRREVFGIYASIVVNLILILASEQTALAQASKSLSNSITNDV